jgi:DHA2 family multidrug resistance protein-like MFS transporter
VLTAVYRGSLDLPAGVPADAAHAARDSVSGAAQGGPAVAHAAYQAFCHSIQVTTLAGAALIAAGAVAALFTLRSVPAVIDVPEEEPEVVPA